MTAVPTIEWHYRRNNCKTCERADDFLARNNIKATKTDDARKTRIGPKDAVALARKASKIYVTKGTKIRHIDMDKDKPDDNELIELIIGPSGNLRAPTLQVGKTLLIGFDEESYQKILG